MASCKPFFTTDPALAPILDELRSLEPIFHTPDFGLEPADFARRTAPDYWEVGASGRRSSRDFILQTLADNPPANAATRRHPPLAHHRPRPPPTIPRHVSLDVHSPARSPPNPPQYHLATNPHRLANPLPPRHASILQ